MKQFLLPIAILFAPHAAFAAIQWDNFKTIERGIVGTIDSIVPILVLVALIGFLWGVGKSMLSAGNPEARAKGRTFMVYGLISLFVIVSVWGILKIAQNSIF